MEPNPEDREPLRVLLLEDVPTDAEITLRELRKVGITFVSKRVETRHDFERALREFKPDLILSDFSLPASFDGLAALDMARDALRDIPYIFVSGTIGEDRAVEAMKRGATDYVLKDRLNRLVPVVKRALDERRERAARRRVEQELEETRGRLDSIVASLSDAVWSVSVEPYRVQFVSRAVEAIWGKSAAEIYADPDAWFEPIHPGDREHVRNIWKKTLAGAPYDVAYRVVRGDGQIRWIHDRGTPIRDAAGRVVRIDGIAVDITERKRNEEALRESEYRLDLALKASDLATWDWNIATGEVRFSGHWWPILGYEPGEISPHIEAWERLTHPDDLARVKSALAAQFKGSVPVLDVEYRMRAKNGDWRWIRTVGRVVERDAAGRALRQTGTHGDITERKLQELKIVRFNRVLSVLSGINSAIVRIRNRRELFDEVCRIAVEHGNFGMAWVSEFDPVTLDVTPVAYAGTHAGDFAGSKTTARADMPLGQGVVGRAIRSGELVFVNDITAEAGIGSVKRREAIRRGYRSVIALPLLVEGAVFGTLTLYTKEPNFFNEDELKLLRELAGDISFALDHIAKTERLDYLAYYDGVTGIPNRKLFHERVVQLIHSLATDEQGIAVAVLDLERFRHINETLGMAAGDTILKQLAERLTTGVGEPGTVARISADRFAMALVPIQSATEIAHVLEQRVLAALAEPFRVGNQSLHIPAKAGVAVHPGDGRDAATLLLNAEAALTNAKRSGERYLFYEPQMNARVAQQLRIENELRKATMEEEFILFYQPRVDLASGRICGMEALIRWQHPHRGLVSPGEFIPVLEQTGMILEAGRWAIKRAVLDYAAWVANGLKPPRIAVNVSQAQLRRKEFVEDVKAALAVASDWDCVDIEITESMLMEDIGGNIGKLGALRATGIGVSLDDFGTGYSSLSWLARLPIDSLKIDRSFVDQMAKSPEQMAIVSTVISLARALNLKVVAEGVETEEQVNLLRLLRCDEAQGYLFYKPLPPEEMAALLR